MRSPLLIAFVALAALSTASAFAAAPRGTLKTNRLLCKTGAETRAASQPLELYFQYNLPVVYEPEDPTVPYGRQILVLQGRPLVVLHFRKSAEPAGENGEKLEPMTCAFAKRVVPASAPNHVQIFLPTGQTHWLTEGIGQRPGPKQLSFERAVIAPAGDWSFASQFDKVFTVDLDDMKNFVTTQLPKAL
jgi:hypothetical protein